VGLVEKNSKGLAVAWRIVRGHEGGVLVGLTDYCGGRFDWGPVERVEDTLLSPTTATWWLGCGGALIGGVFQ